MIFLVLKRIFSYECESFRFTIAFSTVQGDVECEQCHCIDYFRLRRNLPILTFYFLVWGVSLPDSNIQELFAAFLVSYIRCPPVDKLRPKVTTVYVESPELYKNISQLNYVAWLKNNFYRPMYISQQALDQNVTDFSVALAAQERNK